MKPAETESSKEKRQKQSPYYPVEVWKAKTHLRDKPCGSGKKETTSPRNRPQSAWEVWCEDGDRLPLKRNPLCHISIFRGDINNPHVKKMTVCDHVLKILFQANLES